MRIAICDDTLLDLHRIKGSLENYNLRQPSFTLSVATFTNPDDFLQSFALDPNYDLIFLDMVMPFMNGLEVAKTIRASDESVKIVFLTISAEYAIDAYEVKAYHYLIKPVQECPLFRILDEIVLWMTQNQRSHLILRDRESMIKLNIAKIAYVEVMKHRLFYHLMDTSVLTSYNSLSDISTVLLKETQFIKVHKSFIVNCFAVDAIQNQSIIMQDKTIIPISRTLTKPVRQRYIRFLAQQGKIR